MYRPFQVLIYDPTKKKLLSYLMSRRAILPVIFSQLTGSMPWVRGLPHTFEFRRAGYGRFRFKEEKVVKWNCVFRETHPTGFLHGITLIDVTCWLGL